MFAVVIALAGVVYSFSGCLAKSFGDDERIDLSHFGLRIFGKPIENDGKIFESFENAEEVGPYLEGDLLIPSEARSGMRAESLRWKNGEVPFQIRGNYNAFNMDLIERAIIEYHKHTCLKFIPRRSSDRDYISVESGSTGCWSSVGRIGGKQIVNLQTPGCVSKIGTVIHEFLHVLGFLHEQNRDERDRFVTIKTNNIKSGYEINFDKARAGETSGFGVTYDYGSVMHYSANAFSKNSQPTIVAKTNSNVRMGQREGFSQKDIEKINQMYKCRGVTGTDGASTLRPSTTTKPNESIFGGIIEALFPSSSMDEEEIINQ